MFILKSRRNVSRHLPLSTIDWLSSIFEIARMKFSSSCRVSFSLAYGWVRAIFSIVMKAYWIRGGPSSRAAENCLQVRDSKIVGNRVVFSLQM